MKPTADTQIADEMEATIFFCLRRMETVTDSDCRLCFDTHEQLQVGYRHRARCAEMHWVEIAELLPSPSGAREQNPGPIGPDSQRPHRL